MSEATDTTTDEQTETSAAAVLDEIEQELSNSDKVELTDEQMEALGLWGEHGPTRQATIRTKRDVDPVSRKVYDVSDVDGRQRFEFLVLEIHDKQQGDRYTRPYATGLGTASITPASNIDIDALRDRVQTEIDKFDDELGIEMPTDEQLEAVAEFVAESDEALADHALAGERGVWAAAFTGSKLYVEPSDSRFVGFDHVASDIGLTDDQQRVIEDVAIEGETLRGYETNASFGFVAEVSFENDN